MPSVFLKLMSELIFNVIVEKVENLHLTDLKFKHPNEANAVMSKHPTMTIAGCRETKHPHLKKKDSKLSIPHRHNTLVKSR